MRTSSTMQRIYEPENVHLVVTIYPIEPHIKIQDNKVVGGLIGDTINSVFKRLNFTYDIIQSEKLTAGTKLKNGTWLGSFKHIVEDTADMFPGPVTPSLDRLKHGYVGAPYIDTRLSTLTGRPVGGNGGVFTYTTAFGWEVWLGILLVLLLVATLEALFEGQLSSVGFRLFQVLGNLLLESSDKRAQRQTTRVLASFWWLFVLVAANSFAGHLRAMMMLRPKPAKLVTFRDMVQAGVDFDSWQGSFAEYLLMHSFNRDAQLLWTRVEERGTSVDLPSMLMPENLHRTALGKVVLLCLRHSLEFYISQICHEYSDVGEFYFTREGDVYNYPTAMFYNNKLPKWIANRIDRYLVMYFESGLGNKGAMSQFQRCESEHKDENNVKTFGLSDFGGIFLILLFFLGLSLVGFALELVNYRIRAMLTMRTKQRQRRRVIKKEILVQPKRIAVAANQLTYLHFYVTSASPSHPLSKRQFECAKVNSRRCVDTKKFAKHFQNSAAAS